MVLDWVWACPSREVSSRLERLERGLNDLPFSSDFTIRFKPCAESNDKADV